MVYCCLALACLLVATTSVHGLGGRLKFRGQVQQRPSAAAAAAAGRTGKAREPRTSSSSAASTCSASIALQMCPKEGGGGISAAAAAAAVAAAGSLLAESASVLSEAAASGIEAAGGRSALLLSSLSMRGMRALSSVREALPSLPGGDEVDVDEELWSFWQPFQGGRVFVATQVGEGAGWSTAREGGRIFMAKGYSTRGRWLLTNTLSYELCLDLCCQLSIGALPPLHIQAAVWALFSTAFVYFGALAKAILTSDTVLGHLRGWAGVLGAGLVMFAPPSLIALSLLAYEGRRLQRSKGSSRLSSEGGGRGGDAVVVGPPGEGKVETLLLRLPDTSAAALQWVLDLPGLIMPVSRGCLPGGNLTIGCWPAGIQSLINPTHLPCALHIPSAYAGEIYLVLPAAASFTPPPAIITRLNTSTPIMQVLLMYSPLHFYAAFWAVMLALISYRGFVTLWLAVHIPYYVFTSRGRPQHTGKRDRESKGVKGD